jgi:hypothetical protein
VQRRAAGGRVVFDQSIGMVMIKLCIRTSWYQLVDLLTRIAVNDQQRLAVLDTEQLGSTIAFFKILLDCRNDNA